MRTLSRPSSPLPLSLPPQPIRKQQTPHVASAHTDFCSLKREVAVRVLCAFRGRRHPVYTCGPFCSKEGQRRRPADVRAAETQPLLTLSTVVFQRERRCPLQSRQSCFSAERSHSLRRWRHPVFLAAPCLLRATCTGKGSFSILSSPNHTRKCRFFFCSLHLPPFTGPDWLHHLLCPTQRGKALAMV